MQIQAIHHIQLAMPVGGEDAARAFYGTLLGLPEAPKPPALAARGGVWFKRPPLQVHLGVDTAFVPAHKAHPGFLVDDLATLRTRLTDARRMITPAEPVDDHDRFFVDDPFGNRLEFLSVGEIGHAGRL